MLSRALILATVTLLIGDLAAAPAHAQATNLEAGKSPSQIFAGTCTACHKSPRGLLKTVAPGSLPSFLKQHYTTSPDMAGLLSAYLISNGATDTRKDGKPEKPGAPVEQLDRQGRRLHTATPSPEPGKPETKPETRLGSKRLARPAEEGAKPAEAAAPEAGERGPDGRKLTAKQRLSKRGKRSPEEPKDISRPETNRDEPATAGPAKEDKPAAEPAKEEASKPEGVRPSGETRPETAKQDLPKSDTPKSDTLKSDTPKSDTPKSDTLKSDTPKSDAAKIETPKATAPTGQTSPAGVPAASAATTAAPPEPAAGATGQPAAPAAQSAAVENAPPTISVTPAPPAAVAPAGPPAPPISK
jgi:hypothetical protein